MGNNNNKYNLENRRFVFAGAVIVVVIIFIVRLFYLQILDSDYKAWADSNAFYKKTLYPSRGMIYDRNGKLLVFNQPSYEVMVIMREVKGLDTLDFCNTLGIAQELFEKRMADIKNRKLNPGYSSYVPQLFMNHLSAEDYGLLSEKLYKYPGFYIQNRTIREYEYPVAAHVLGNIGEVNRKDIENDKYYVQGDYSGRSGLERSYETYLRGEKGVELLLRDAHGRIKGKYEDGAHDVEPVSGKSLTLGIDIDLQAYGEMLMQNKRGAIVMIEPATGEVLCMVSAPFFDPKLLVGRQRGNNYAMLEKNQNKPLLDRTIMAQYPPGSTFKPTQGLIFLHEGILTPQTVYTCHMGYPYGGGKPACHGHYSPLGLQAALATSCNAYFCWGLRDMLDVKRSQPTVQEAYDVWRDHLLSMGYGQTLGIDLPNEKRGYIPDSKFYDTVYRERWNSSTIRSIAIGQGEILSTPLQICNLSATIANRGYFYTPHVVKDIREVGLDARYREERYTTIGQEYYDVVADGMRDAVLGGTCRRAAIQGIQVCGKTGTAENPGGKDHSIFMGFAPYENPEVAICVFVENAGFGATYAVPIGKLMMEKYLKREIDPQSQYLEDFIVNAVLTPTHAR